MDDEMTLHEFKIQYPEAKEFDNLGKARMRHRIHGGLLWHMTMHGMISIGYPTRDALRYYVTDKP